MNETFNIVQEGKAMTHIPADIRLTDELERQLMQQAIEEQFRFKPMVALKNLFAKISGSAHKAAPAAIAPRTVEHAG